MSVCVAPQGQVYRLLSGTQTKIEAAQHFVGSLSVSGFISSYGMTALEQYDLAHDSAFVRRVTQLTVKSAIAVSSEDPATANHAARIAWGNKVLLDPAGYGSLMAHGVVTNAAITAASSDSDVEFTINSMWNAYAVA
jgi:hypothetical protein